MHIYHIYSTHLAYIEKLLLDCFFIFLLKNHRIIPDTTFSMFSSSSCSLSDSLLKIKHQS